MQESSRQRSNRKLTYSLIFINICGWVVFVIPFIYLKGLDNLLASLNSSPFSLFITFSLLSSICMMLFFFMYLVAIYYLNAIDHAEESSVINRFLNDNPPVQLWIVFIGNPERNSFEILTWGVIIFSYAYFKSFCVLVSSRLSGKKIRNLQVNQSGKRV